MVWCRAGVRSYFPISLHRLFLRASNARKPLKPACTIPCIELNPPTRIALLKVPDSSYNSKLLTNKISDYEKEIGFYYCGTGYFTCS